MAVRYITVTPVTNMFKPATRSFGDIAIIGAVDTDTIGPSNTPIPITNPDNVGYNSAKSNLSSAIANAASTTINVVATGPSGPQFPTGTFRVRINDEILRVTNVSGTTWTVTRGDENTTAVSHASGTLVTYPAKDSVDSIDWFKGNLGKSIRIAFDQSPGPMKVWAVRADLSTASERTTALAEVAKLNVQIVVLSNTSLSSTTVGRTEIEALASHVNTVSNNGGDGKERIGVAMLGKDIINTSFITPNMSIDRMVMVAHKSVEDAASAVAGTIAGYQPHISLLLKQVKIGMDELFSDSEIDTFNSDRVNWLTDPVLLPGKGIFMGEGYTLGADQPYIDIPRTIDDISFRLKANLIRSIGKLRVSRSGLRVLVSQMTAVLEPLKTREVIESYDVFIPLLVLLDKEPTDLTATELQQINNAQNDRTVDVIVSVDYAGAIHRLNITLKFE